MIDRINKRPYLFLCIVSLLTGILLYSQFIFGDKILAYAAWGSDTRQSYLPTYEFWHNRIAEGRFSIYDFSYGWGTNVFVALWGIADPFSAIPILLSLVFGINFIGRSLVYFQLLKSVLISLLGMRYLKMLGYSGQSAFLPSYALGYCGYMIVTGEHYFFSTYAVFFMLILIYTEKTLQSRRFQWGLVAATAWMSILSAYAFFQTALAIGLYVLVRNSMLEERASLWFWNIWLILKGAAIGFLCSAFSFLAQAYEIFVISGRTDRDVSLWEKAVDAMQLLSDGFLQETVYNLFSNNLFGTINQYQGYGGARFCTTPWFMGVLLSFSLTYFLYKTIKSIRSPKTFAFRMIIFILGLIILFTCFYTMLTNLFVYLQWRFVFTMLPFGALALTDFLEDLFSEKKIPLAVFVIPAVIATAITGSCNIDENAICFSAVCMLAATLLTAVLCIVFSVTHRKKNLSLLWAGLLCITGAHLLADDAVVLYKDQRIMQKSELLNGYRDARIEEILTHVEEAEKDTFYRIDRTYADGTTPDIMLSFVHPARTLSVYDSMINTNLVDAVTTLSGTYFYTQEGYNIGSCGTKFDAALADIYGLKYVISNMQRQLPDWDLYEENNGLYVYKNAKQNGAGLLYRKCITQEAYQKLDDVAKAFAFSSYIITDEAIGNPKDTADLSYTDITERITGIEEWEACDLVSLNMPQEESRHTVCLSMELSGEIGRSLTISIFNQNGNCTDQKQVTTTEGQKRLICNVPNDAATVKIEYDKQTLSIAGYGLYQNAKTDYSGEGVFLENKKMGSVIEGNIEAQQPSYLLLPVPYEENWNIWLNGEKAEYAKADFGFMMVKIESGKHDFRMEYDNRINKAGLWISLLTLAGIAIYLTADRMRRKQAGK